MEKFNIKKMYGYYWMIISFIVPLLFFIVLLGFTIYLKSNSYIVPNKDNINFAFIVFMCIDIFIALFCIVKIITYIYLFLPFRNSIGKIVIVKITERSIFETMHGTIESENTDNTVKIIFRSRGSDFFKDYDIGDYAECFIREKDLSNPKVVVLYR